MKRYAMRDGERVSYLALNDGDVVTLHEPDGELIRDGGAAKVRIVGWPEYDGARVCVVVETERCE
jgi:hypothetical protein